MGVNILIKLVKYLIIKGILLIINIKASLIYSF